MALFSSGDKVQVYGKACVFFNAALAADLTKVTVKQVSSSKPMVLLQSGYSGESPGALMREVSTSHAMPRKGFGFDFFQAHKDCDPFDIVLWLSDSEGAKGALPANLTMTGQLLDVGLESSADGITVLSLSFRCRSLDGLR